MARVTAGARRTSPRALADETIVEHAERFFKCGKGEYGEGDKFLGIRVPMLRQRVKNYREMSRASLRYAIEKFSAARRKDFLYGKV